MAGYISDDTRKVTTHRLVEMKQRGEKISMLTAYDYTMAQIVDGAGMDVILVGDVYFHDRELGIVRAVHALVAEVLAELVYAVEPSDDQLLEV